MQIRSLIGKDWSIMVKSITVSANFAKYEIVAYLEEREMAHHCTDGFFECLRLRMRVFVAA